MLYKEMYFCLFRSVTKAIDALQDGDFLEAKKLLIRAQQDTEEMYISAGEETELEVI